MLECICVHSRIARIHGLRGCINIPIKDDIDRMNFNVCTYFVLCYRENSYLGVGV